MARRDATRLAGDQLYYQILHNLLLEMTRATLEVKNLRMRVESIGSRLEFNERRTRSLESAAFAVTSEKSAERPARPPSPPPPPPIGSAASSPGPSAAPMAQGSGQPGEGSASRSRRRRRRRGRRGAGQHPPGGSAPAQAAGAPQDAPAAPPKEDLETFSGAAAHPSEAELPPPPDDGDDSQ